MQRIKFLSYPFLYLLFPEEKVFLEYMTKEQQSHGAIANFYWLLSRAEISETGY